ncbi:MAG: HAD family hydrolase [Candidatus Nealsonbacteria bacterium]|nr:HAD family hydrolase [Candidatus Nealsonbacteria bacterium]
MIKNIIFDWSGVINDDLHTVYRVVLAIFKKFGVKEISLEEFRKEWEQPYMLFYRKYGISGISREEEVAIYKSLYKDLSAKYPPRAYPKIKDTLVKFKKAGINMIILSSNLRETILYDIEEFNLQGLFTEINSEIHDKNDGIQETIKRNGFNPQETVFVGDTTHEVDVGKKAGIKTAAVTWGYNNEDKLKSVNPDFIIHDLEELEKAVFGC